MPPDLRSHGGHKKLEFLKRKMSHHMSKSKLLARKYIILSFKKAS